MVKLWSMTRNPRILADKFRSDTMDDIVDLESNAKLKIIPMHRFTLSELRFMSIDELVKYKVMLKRLWEQQNPTA